MLTKFLIMKKFFALLLGLLVIALATPSCSQIGQVDDDIGISYSWMDDASPDFAFAGQIDKESPPLLSFLGVSYDIQRVASQVEKEQSLEIENNDKSDDIWNYIYWILVALVVLFDIIVRIWPTTTNISIFDFIHEIYRRLFPNRKTEVSNKGKRELYKIE